MEFQRLSTKLNLSQETMVQDLQHKFSYELQDALVYMPETDDLAELARNALKHQESPLALTPLLPPIFPFIESLCQIDQILEFLNRQTTDSSTLCVIDPAIIEDE